MSSPIPQPKQYECEIEELRIKILNVHEEIARGQRERILGERSRDRVVAGVMDQLETAEEELKVLLGTAHPASEPVNQSKLKSLLLKMRNPSLWRRQGAESDPGSVYAKIQFQKDIIADSSSTITTTTAHRKFHSELARLALYGILPSLDQSPPPLPRTMSGELSFHGGMYSNIHSTNLFSDSGPALNELAVNIEVLVREAPLLKSKHRPALVSVIRDTEALILSIGRNMRLFPRDATNHFDHIVRLEIGVLALNEAHFNVKYPSANKPKKSLSEQINDCKNHTESRTRAFEMFLLRQAEGLTKEDWLDASLDYKLVDIQDDEFVPEGTHFQTTRNVENLVAELRDVLKLKQYSEEIPRRAKSVASGGFAKIYTATLPNSNEEVAVKLPDKSPNVRVPEWRWCIRILREARIWAKTSHQNILPLRGFWTNFHERSKFPALISPWCPAGTLLQYVVGKCTPARLELMTEVATGLEYLHSSVPQIIHGDLRANNILIHEGRACLSDFGLSKIMDGVRGCTTKPHGNERWLAPEVIAKTKTNLNPMATTSADIYSLGCVFLEVLTDDHPFPDLEDDEVRSERLSYNISRPPKSGDISEEHWAFMTECWAIEPTARPTVGKALQKLKAFRDGVWQSRTKCCEDDCLNVQPE
ncbi:kinase-like protein [Rickenella mellea]|uniref:Kinase-like protein n=1 Tax=Rickenella mellea TaxID=50990 RepID=A0A4Y7Q932_9AGAM|nr:kinase-like protein [Rickenella mellea]